MLMIVKQLQMAISHCKARLQTAFAVILLLHFLLFKTRFCTCKGTMMIHITSMRMNAEKSAFMMVQMWLADSQLSVGHCDVVRSICAAFGALFSITDAFVGLGRCSEALERPFAMLPWCFLVLFCDGCVP